MSTSTQHSISGKSVMIAIVATVVVLVVSAAIGAVVLMLPKPYEFPQHQKISSSSLLRLSFPSVMDHDSVLKNISVSGGFSYSPTWEGETLVLRPDAQLQQGSVIKVVVDGQAMRSDGTIIGSDITFTFTVAGAPILSATIPENNAVSVPTNADILVVFDRPVVSLSAVKPGSWTSLKELPVRLNPPVSGRWRWLGTTTAEFHPDRGLMPATRYTVMIPAGVHMVSGESTDRDLSFSFETERPRLLSSDPQDGATSAGSTTVIRLTFNAPMDLISAKDFIRLFRSNGKDALQPVQLGTVKYGTIKEQDGTLTTDKKTVVAVPSSPLLFGTSYTVTVAEGIRGLQGTLGSQSGVTMRFSTVGHFKVVKAAYENGGILMDFTSPVDSQKLKDVIAFDPPVDLKDMTGDTYETSPCDDGFTPCNSSGPATVHRFSYFAPLLNPSTKYTMTILPAFSDRYGQHLEKPFSLTFTTPAIDSEAFFYPRGKDFSIFEKSKPPLYYVNSVNISELQLGYTHLNFEQFLQARKRARDTGFAFLNADDLKAVSTEYKTATLKPADKLNVWESKKLDLQKVFGNPGPGIYALTVTAPEWKSKPYRPNLDQRFFAVTNMGMTVKYSGSRILVWVTDLETGSPVSGASIKVRALSGDVPVSGSTDKNGLFETALSLEKFRNETYDWQPEFWVTAEKGNDFAFVGSNWNEGISPYNFDGVSQDFRSPSNPPNRMIAYLYTERPLYGAGDTVYFRGITRLLNSDGKLSVPEATRSVYVTVNDPNGTVIYAKTLKMNAFGSFADELPIATEAPLGQYSIQAKMLPDADVDSYTWAGFSVLAYRKPEYKVSVTSDHEEYTAGDTAELAVSGQYYFGAPMNGSSVTWRLLTSNYYFNKYTEGWYSFALEDAWCWRNCERGESVVTEGKGELDVSGRLKVKTPLSTDDKSVSQLMTFEADITDKNNQVVSSRAYMVVHKSDVYVGISSDDYAVNAGEAANVKVITLTPEGTPVSSQKVTLNLYARTWNTVKTKGVDGEYYYDSEPEDRFITSVDTLTGQDGKATAQLKIPDGGEYRVVAETKDTKGHESRAGWSLYAFADTYFNWPRSNNDRIDIVADKPTYKVGETAKLVVKTPYQGPGVKALVTVEREQIMEKYVVDVKGNALPVDVKIGEGSVPVVYVSVIVMKPRIGETFDDNGKDTGAPAFKMGYVRLPVDTSSKRVNVTIETDREKYLPGDTVEVKLKTTDSQGRPVATDVSLGVVDMSLLDLTGFELPDIVSSFYTDRGTGLETANMLLYLMERFKPGSKGGGGDGESSRTRGTFKDTAYWNPSIVTGKDGTASTSFTLPDNLTTWQLLAIGSTNNSLFGSFAKTVVETKKVIVRPVRPRFAVTGDTVKLGAIVHNFLGKEATFRVTLDVEGLKTQGKREQSVTLADGEDAKLEFPVTVLDATGAVIHFSAETTGAKDDIVERFPIWTFGTEQAVATSGMTEDNVTEHIVVPTASDARDGTLAVSLSPSLSLYLMRGLNFLSEYPYGCAEQIASKFIPALALTQLSQYAEFGAEDPASLQRNAVASLQKLYVLQNFDGGFAYFAGGRSFAPLSSYILDSLNIAKNSGLAVDQRVMDRAAGYLKSELSGRAGNSGSFSDPSSRAYALYVLSKLGPADQAALSSLLKKPELLPLFSRAHIALAYKNAGNTSKAKEVLSGILNSVKTDQRSAHFEEDKTLVPSWSMNDDVRTSAIVLSALSAIEPEHPIVPKLVRGILLSRKDGHWNTTQTTAQVIFSVVSYLKATDELDYDERGAVSVGGDKMLDFSFKSPRLVREEIVKSFSELPRGSEIAVELGKEGKGRLYYDIVMKYFATPTHIEPAEEGIGILRETEPLTPSDASGKTGTIQKVTLTITVPETRNFVAVESMLPAAYEPIDVGYATSQQGLLSNAANASDGFTDFWKNQTWRFSHIEFRDDRVFLFADELPAGVYRYEYLVRVTSAGTFHERPARVFEMYSPEVFGQTAGGKMTVSQ